MQKNEIADAANDTLVTIKSEVLPEVACLNFSFLKKNADSPCSLIMTLQMCNVLIQIHCKKLEQKKTHLHH